MNYHEEIIGAIELHSVEGIINCFKNGVSPNGTFNNDPLIFELTSEYTRSPAFKDCVKAFVDHGLQFEHKALLSVLLNDATLLEKEIAKDPGVVSKKVSLRCAYTPLFETTLLHVCAEFNHVACAEVLLQHGADVNAKAGLDENGFGGQTPIFHTVNQNSNQSEAMMQFLLLHKADLQITVRGLIWGKGYPWETFIPSVNPISYAMMGRLPQMHRDEQTTAGIISILLKHAFDMNYKLPNIPNKYLL